MFAMISDTHFGARNDSQLYYKHMRSFFQDIFWKEIDRNNVNIIFHLGDFFDRRKFINFQTLELSYELFFYPAIQRNMTCYFIVGNHDTYYKNNSDLNALNLIVNNQKHYKKFYVVQNIPETVNLGGGLIHLVPWINTSNQDIFMEKLTNEWKPGETIFGHFEISGFDMGGMINYSGYKSEMFSNFNVYSGHFHRKQSSGSITYIGSPFQFTWNDYNSEKGFYIGLCKNHKESLQFIKNPVNIFKQIDYKEDQENKDQILTKDYSEYKDSYVKILVKNRTDQFLFDLFLERLNEFGPFEVKVIDQLDLENMDPGSIGGVDEAKSTLEILQNCISDLNLDDSEEISRIVADLYKNANFME